MIKLIASDLDGTLLTDKKELSKVTREALDMAISNGIYMIPATGRSFKAVPDMIKNYPGVEYVITSNGGVIYSVSKKERIYQCLLEAESAVKILKMERPANVVMEIFIKGIPYSEEAMAFGDADNDSSMLKAVKYGIAMDNGTKACKAAAAFITASNEDDGVAKAIYRFCSQ